MQTGKGGNVWSWKIRQNVLTKKIREILKSIWELLYVLNRDNEITGTPILKILSFKKIHTEMAAYVVMQPLKNVLCCLKGRCPFNFFFIGGNVEYLKVFLLIPSSLLISSYFLAKRFFFSKLCFDYPIIFSGIEVCMVRAQALAKAILALANAQASNLVFSQADEIRRLSPNFVTLSRYNRYNDKIRHRMSRWALFFLQHNSMNPY